MSLAIHQVSMIYKREGNNPSRTFHQIRMTVVCAFASKRIEVSRFSILNSIAAGRERDTIDVRSARGFKVPSLTYLGTWLFSFPFSFSLLYPAKFHPCLPMACVIHVPMFNKISADRNELFSPLRQRTLSYRGSGGVGKRKAMED